MPAKLTADRYHQIAKEKNIEWIGTRVPTTKEKTLWRCHCGREFETTYASIDRNAGNCYECGLEIQVSKRRLKPESYTALAHESGLRWLGPVVFTALTKTTWECSEGHQWEAEYNRIQQGHGCPYCAGQGRKTPQDYHDVCNGRNMEWLGPEVSSTSVNTKWLCLVCGERWQATYSNISKDRQCPRCAYLKRANKLRMKPKAYKQLATRRGFVWLGPEVPVVTAKTGWRCENGHEWEATYHAIRKGTGCPECLDFENGQRVSQPQRDLHAMLEAFGTAVLNAPYGRLNIDIALTVGDVQIAVEYDAWYWHKDKLDKDARRDRKLIRDGWHVLRVKSSTSLPTMEQLETAVGELVNGRFYAEIVLPDWG